MKYRVTPGNCFFLFVLGVYIYYMNNTGDARAELGVSIIFFFAVIVLLGDFFLQLLIKNYNSLLLVEMIALPVVIVLALIA